MTFDYAGPFQSVRLRLLPWKPRLRGDRDWGPDMGNVGDIGGDDLGFGLLLGVGLLALVALPVLLVLVVLSLEIALLLLLVPVFLVGQLLGLQPWQIALRSMDGDKHYVTVKGTRKMLEARRYYRTLLAS